MAPDLCNSSRPLLLSLPTEIRNHIFTLVAVEAEPLLATTRKHGYRSYALPGPPALTRTCRQARREVLPIFYGANTLLFDTKRTNPAMWHDSASTQIRDASNHVTQIILRRERNVVLDAKHTLHNKIEVEFYLDNTGKVRASYSGSFHVVCACIIKKVIRETVVRHDNSASGTLFSVAAALHELLPPWAKYGQFWQSAQSTVHSCGSGDTKRLK